MNASKENCAKAKELLLDQVVFLPEEHAKFILSFLDAAHKKLPRETSYDNEKKVEDAARKGFES